MTQKQIQTTLLDRLESIGLERFYFLQKQKVAKTLARFRTSCGFYFLDTSLHFVSLSMASGGVDSLGMMNGLDCHDLPLASLAMTKIATPSLRGSLSDSENNEAIHKNKIDCHENHINLQSSQKLAMTKK